MNYLVSLVPIVMYLILIKSMDGFSLGKWGRIAECMVWGIFSCFACMFIGRLFKNGTGDFFPVVEEFVKCAPLALAVYRKRSAFFAETLIYGSAIGAGFSLLENTLYLLYSPKFALGDAILRGVGTSLLHIGCTSLFASVTLIFSRIAANKTTALRVVFALVAIIPSVVIHVIYNLFLIPEYIQMLALVMIFIVAFIIAYDIDGKLIHKWLDMCITNDIALFSSMKKGQLHTTNAGQYLLEAKERFSPEVFFDICVYLGLYLEMNIAAKSRMIMKESGLDMPVSEKEHRENHDKLIELENLRCSIGKSGLLLLSPLIDFKAADQWAMNELM